ncbi:kinase-like domain-containing protein [Gautieria morchelliformis]|nr:kinase-like domain-containing protein [Gautieria morchelliformis]
MAGKRASSPPACQRPSKRLAVSSPEEGELVDKSASPDAHPAQKFHNSRVPFPFKKPPGSVFSPPSLPPLRSPFIPPPPPGTAPPLPPPDGLPGKLPVAKHENLKRRPPPYPSPPVCKESGEVSSRPEIEVIRHANGRGSRPSSDVPREKSYSAMPRQDSPKKPRRPPVKRTVAQERCAYGRVFVGCGQMDDYDVTTKVGEGTFGEVHKATHRPTSTAVALKRILMHNEKEGMPITALREIRILKRLNHPNVVQLREVIVQGSPPSFHMVFPYMDHDLAGLLENDRVQMTPSQIKLYMRQLLEGTAYLHANNIIHRDMKAANLLISNTGLLQIADFGLARAFDPRAAIVGRRNGEGPHSAPRYTNCVVTRWYRPPELFLGARRYGGEIDIWGIGCVLGEIFIRRPILMGTSDANQLDLIWQLCGSPSGDNWPDYDSLPGLDGVKRWSRYDRQIKIKFHGTGVDTVDLLDKLLILDPSRRITAAAALDHDWFWSDPMPADPKMLPKYESSHEIDKRVRRHVPAPMPPPPQSLPGAGGMPHSLPPPLYNNPNNPNMAQPPNVWRPGPGWPAPPGGPRGPRMDPYRPGPYGPPPPGYDHHRPPNGGFHGPPPRDIPRGPAYGDGHRGHGPNPNFYRSGPSAPNPKPFPPPGTHGLPPKPNADGPVPVGRGGGWRGGGWERGRGRGRGRDVEGRGRDVEGRGRDVEGRGRDVEGRGRDIEGDKRDASFRKDGPAGEKGVGGLPCKPSKVECSGKVPGLHDKTLSLLKQWGSKFSEKRRHRKVDKGHCGMIMAPLLKIPPG